MTTFETEYYDDQDDCTAGDDGIAVMLDSAGIDRTALKAAQSLRKKKAAAQSRDALLAAARSII